jgi:lipid II:glycine glycyltransferase (peptidoglycan interpeptide bridge formation enzyme)
MIERMELDDAGWDAFVAGQPNGHLLQSSGWGRFKAGAVWEATRLAVGEGGEALAGALVLLRRLPLGQRLAYIPKGPAGRWAEATVGPAFWTAVHAEMRRRGAFLLKVEPEELDDGPAARALLSGGFRPSAQTVQPRSTVWLDLQGAEDALRGRMRPKTRYNIGLAERKGIAVREGGPDDLPAFGRLMAETGGRDGFAVHGTEYYARAYHEFAPAGACALLLATFEERVIAGLMVFAQGPTAWYMYGASSNAERQRMPNHALQWAAMRWAKDKGCRTYDLWGIPDEVGQAPERYEETVTERQDGLWGVYRFKQGFGGRVIRYAGAFDYAYSPARCWLYRQALRLRRSAALG